jgi:siderophore synthetase component
VELKPYLHREDGPQVPFSKDLEGLDAALQSDTFVEVRRRIFRQLVSSLVYEGVLKPEVEPLGESLRFRLRGEDEAGLPVEYVCEGRRCFSFERIRLGSAPVMRGAGSEWREAESLSRFLLDLRGALGAEPERLARFIQELEQTLLKDTQAQHRRRLAGLRLRERSYDELEGELMDGHPYHPSYKSRIGFDCVDNVAFGPEFSPALRPLWLAVHRKWTHVAASRAVEPRSFLQQELGEDTWVHFMKRLQARGLEPREYHLLPVHPWQWREQLVGSAFEALREGQLVMLGAAHDDYTPQQSIRTLANRSHPERASLKLALGITNTSTSRILAPHTVRNAPLISDWLAELVASDGYLRDELRPVILREVLGVTFDPPAPELLRARTYGMTACVWRESLHPYLEAGEQALPFTGLCHLDSDGRPLCEPWMQRMGADAWVRRLLEVSVPPVVHLLHRHGIALEAHAQNMVLLHIQGEPRRIALKDFHDGIRFSPAHLGAPEQRPALHATPAAHARVNRNSYLETPAPEEVRDFVHDAFFFINLAEFALFLAEHLGYDERRFWTHVRDVLAAHRRRFPELRERFALFDLEAPVIQVEQLTKRRLYPDTEPRVHAVRNALAALGPEGEGRS